jgi:DNA-binding SARP family transcriptional activator
MRFGVLGPLEVSVDRLIDDLWGDDLPGNPVGALRGKVSQLRRALDGAERGARNRVAHGPAGYALRVEPEDVDAGRFERLVDRAQRTETHRSKASLLSEALDLWLAPAFAGLRGRAVRAGGLEPVGGAAADGARGLRRGAARPG